MVEPPLNFKYRNLLEQELLNMARKDVDHMLKLSDMATFVFDTETEIDTTTRLIESLANQIRAGSNTSLNGAETKKLLIKKLQNIRVAALTLQRMLDNEN